MATATLPPSNSLAAIRYVSTAYADSRETKPYNDTLQKAAADAEETILGYLSERDEIRRLFSLVDQAYKNGADWDDQEGEAVSFETAQHAKLLLRDLARRTEAGSKTWKSPAISATPDGGIHLSWLTTGSRVTLTVFAPFKDTVSVSKLRGEPSRRELVSDSGAVERVMKAFEASLHESSIGDRNIPR
jgi:hypothetical protein